MLSKIWPILGPTLPKSAIFDFAWHLLILCIKVGILLPKMANIEIKNYGIFWNIFD
jgi:hypothetical protein